MDRYNVISGAGLVGLLVIAWCFSSSRWRMNWRVIGWGVGLQLALGALVFRLPGSREAFLRLNDAVLKVLDAATAGQRFVFGRVAVAPGETNAAGEGSLGFMLAFQALPVIIFFAALMGLFYYWRIMPLIVRCFAWLFTRLMRLSGAEGLCAASNIFVGIESATTIRPYLSGMTRSEFCTILTAGMATVASSTLGLYVMFLGKVFPTIAGHLISASILSVPAAIVMSKIVLPETGEPATMGRSVALDYREDSGAIEAIINGAMAGVRLVVGVVALLIAFLGMVALVNLVLGGLSGGEWSLERLLGYLMWPLAVLIGVPPADAAKAGEMIGMRMIATEIPAYRQLALVMSKSAAEGGFLHARSAMVTAYALCGFAHVASLAIFVGGIAALVPERRTDLASVGPRALLAATLACLMTGAVAGTFFHRGALVLGSGG